MAKTGVALFGFAVLLLATNGISTSTKSKYGLVSYMAPTKLEIQHGIWVCNGLLCPANAYGCRFVRNNSPEQLQLLWATDTCLDYKGQILIENGYTIENPVHRSIDIDVNTYMQAITEYCSTYNINTEMVKGTIAPKDWQTVMYDVALKTASFIYMAQNTVHTNEISVVQTINVTYHNNKWTCNGIKCPKQTYGCHVIRKTGPHNKLVLNMVDICLDKDKHKLMSRTANINMGTERLIDIDLESYIGAHSDYTIDTFYDNEFARGVVGPNGWKKFFIKFKQVAKNRFSLSKKPLNYTSTILTTKK